MWLSQLLLSLVELAAWLDMKQTSASNFLRQMSLVVGVGGPDLFTPGFVFIFCEFVFEFFTRWPWRSVHSRNFLSSCTMGRLKSAMNILVKSLFHSKNYVFQCRSTIFLDNQHKHIMFSYSHKIRKEEVHKMKARLEEQGYKVWIDEEQITSGETFFTRKKVKYL